MRPEMQKILDVERQTRRKPFLAAAMSHEAVLADLAEQGLYVTSLYQDRSGEVWHCSLRYSANGRLARVSPGIGTCMDEAMWDAAQKCAKAGFPEREVPEEKLRERAPETGGVTLAKPYVPPPKGAKVKPSDDLDDIL